MRAVSRIGMWRAGQSYVWRGVVDATWDMSSSLFRLLTSELGRRPTESEMRQRERALLFEAREWGLGLELGASATDLHLLATLQHHGLPTRLLDVTQNPMTAMYFACEPRPDGDGRPGVMFAFNVAGFAKFKTIDANQSPTSGAVGHGVHESLRQALAESRTTGRPVIIEPTLRDARMTAQEGLFLASWTPKAPRIPHVDDLALPTTEAPTRALLNKHLSPPVRPAGMPNALPFCALVIPARLKQRVLMHLERTYNRTRAFLYPDITGFAHELELGALSLDRAGTEEPI
jgi:hypothetical protein